MSRPSMPLPVAHLVNGKLMFGTDLAVLLGENGDDVAR